MKGRGLAAVAVRSLERGFQGENLSVDDWGLLGDWGLRQYLQFKQLGEQDGLVTFVALAALPDRTHVDIDLEVGETVGRRAVARA